MNFVEALKARLIENGLFESNADAIMKIALEDKESFSEMRGRWGNNVDGYPVGFVNILFSTLRPIAYKWICENAPMAWFRVIFAPGINGLEGKEMEEFIANYHCDLHKADKLASRLPNA